MAMIKLADNFEIIKEGTYTFTITAVDYQEEYGKLKISLKSSDGQMVWQNYNFYNADNTTNDKALKSFSYFARISLNNTNVDEIDPKDLVNHVLKARVEHQVVASTTNPNETKTFVRLVDLESVEQPQASGNSVLDILG